MSGKEGEGGTGIQWNHHVDRQTAISDEMVRNG